MKQAALRVVVAVVLCLSAAPAAAQQPTGPKDRGFALEVQLGTRLLALNIAGFGAYSLSAVDGGFFAGYKFGRWQVGGSLDFARVSVSNGNDQASSVLTFMPGVRVAILRSADERVELFGQVDFGFGHVFQDNLGDDHNRIVYQLGPGVRLWFHPNFALGALVGLRGEFDLEEGTNGTTTGLTSIFARVTFTGVF
ncbi:MAG: porin [Deltaproteobacteria bacterium]|nr:porin [Deltaproteobacteria bacterium]